MLRTSTPTCGRSLLLIQHQRPRSGHLALQSHQTGKTGCQTEALGSLKGFPSPVSTASTVLYTSNRSPVSTDSSTDPQCPPTCTVSTFIHHPGTSACLIRMEEILWCSEDSVRISGHTASSGFKCLTDFKWSRVPAATCSDEAGVA